MELVASMGTGAQIEIARSQIGRIRDVLTSWASGGSFRLGMRKAVPRSRLPGLA